MTTQVSFEDLLQDGVSIDVRAIEERVARISAERRMSPIATRSILWASICRALLDRASVEASARMVSLVEMTVDFTRSSLAMELLRYAVIAEDDRFKWLKTKAYAYDPFISNSQRQTFIPPLSELRPFLNIDPESVEAMVIEGMGEETPVFTVPQAIPGLGYLIATHPICDVHTLCDRIEEDSLGVDGHPSDGHPSDGHPSDGHPSDGRREKREEQPTEGRKRRGLNDGSSDDTEILNDPRAEEVRRGLHAYFTSMTKRLKIRIMVVDLVANIEGTESLIKYNTAVISLDSKNRGKVVTSQLIEALDPFRFPPTLIRRTGFFASKDVIGAPLFERVEELRRDMHLGREHPEVPDPVSVTFGEKGPLYVVLDYGYGVTRYLILSASKEVIALPSYVSTFQHLGPPTSTENLYIIDSVRHFRFLSEYLPNDGIGVRRIDRALVTRGKILEGSVVTAASRAAEHEFLPSHDSMRFEPPLPGFDLFESAYIQGIAYMRQFVVDLDRGHPVERSRAVRRIRLAHMNLFEERLRVVLHTDINEGHVVPYSPGSESSGLIIEFEISLLGR